MSSLQQAPAKGQQVPPAVLIDGISQQQIDEAVKARVKEKRAAKVGKSVFPAGVQKQIIDMILKCADKQIDMLRDALDEEQEDVNSSTISEALSDTVALALICSREVQRMQTATYDGIDALTLDMCCVATLVKAMRECHGRSDNYAGRILLDWDVRLLGQMELAELAGFSA